MTTSKDPVDEVLPPAWLFTYGLQHVLAMYAGAVAVPLIIANGLGLPREQLIYLINADLFTCGVATLIQTLGVGPLGIRLPIIQGVTFAAVTPMILIGKNVGLAGIYGSVIAAGFFTLLLSAHFSRLIAFFPPLVTGTIITVIGISLLPVAVRWCAGGNPSSPEFGGVDSIGLAFAVLVVIVVFHRVLPGFWRNISVLLGLVVGSLVAWPLGMFSLAGVDGADWVGVTTPFAFGFPTFDPGAVLAMSLVMLVVMVETTGDFVAVGEIVGRTITQADLTRGLRADGFATMLGGMLNAFPYTAYAQNVGLVGLTRVKSRFVVASAGAILVVLGLFPKAAAIVAAVPAPVLGGAGLVMFGTVAASGIKTLSGADFSQSHASLVVAVSLAVGLIPLAAPGFYARFPAWLEVILHSGITAGSLTAVLLNTLLRDPRKNRSALSADLPGRCA